MQPSDIPGQADLKRVFREMADENRAPHAMLLHENRGGSGLALALLLAQTMLCTSREGGDPCGTCPQCIQCQSLTHPDIHFVFPTNTNARIKKTEQRFSDNFYPEWREAVHDNLFLSLADWYRKIDIEKKQGIIGDHDVTRVREKLSLRAHSGGVRIFIIWHAEKMNDSFANKILKNLEEPSKNTMFLLISDSPASLLTTIISRVQIFREDHLDEELLADMLVAKYDLEKRDALAIAFRAEGNISSAIREANEEEEPWLMEFKSWMRLAYSRDLAGLLKWSDSMTRRNRDEQRQFCRAALAIIDRCYRMGWIEVNIPMESSDLKFFLDFSPFINTVNAQGFLELVEEASAHIERNVSGRMVWFDSSIKATRLVHYGKKSAAE
ncbi:MAG: DNA polymerase III subunit delta' [Salibacteraceae bacterium]